MFFWPSMKSMVAMIDFKYSQQQSFDPSLESQAIKRKVQKFFLKYNLSIGYDDIFVQVKEADKHHQSGCQKHAASFYMPFLVRYPYFGHTMYEWCVIIHT